MRIMRTFSASWLRRVLISSLFLFVLALFVSVRNQDTRYANSDYEWRQRDLSYYRNPIPKENGPVKHFIYYVPQKTSSTQTRNRMHKFCVKHDLVCMEDQYKNCSRIRYQNCMKRKIARHVKLNVSDHVHKGIVTAEKMKLCCPTAAWNRTFDGAFYHYWYSDPESRKYLRDHTYNDAFEFTILRDPVDHFISWYRYITMNKGSTKLNSQTMSLLRRWKPDIYEIVDLLYTDEENNFINTTYPFERYGRRPRGNKTKSWQMHEFLTNMQSKMLGWSGKPEEWGVAVKKLESLDFVGITEELCCSWQLLRAKMNWAQKDLRCTKKMSINRYKIKEETLRKIRAMQWADIALYERAKQIFRQYGALCQGSIPQKIRYLGVEEPGTSSEKGQNPDDPENPNDDNSNTGEEDTNTDDATNTIDEDKEGEIDNAKDVDKAYFAKDTEENTVN